MKKSRRTPLLICLTLSAALLIVVYRTLTSPAMGAFVREQIIAFGRKEGLPIRIDRIDRDAEPVSCGLLSCRAKALSIVIPKAFSYFRFEEIVVSPRLLSFVLNKPHILIEGRLYGGEFSGDVVQHRKENSFVVSLAGTGLQASEMPQFEGITGGNLNFILQDLKIDRTGIAFGPSSIEIRNATKPGRTTLSTMKTGLPVAIEIPAISSFNVRIKADMSDGKLRISEGVLSSSLGSVDIRGDVTLPARRGGPTGFSLSGRTEINADGMREISNYPLITGALNISGRKGPQKLEYALNGDSSNPNFTTKPLP